MEMSYWGNWIIEEQYIFYIVFNITYFFHHCVHCTYYVKKTPISNINTHFMIRTTYVEFQTSATILPQGNNFWSQNKKNIYDNEK
jgi:hypothetical protein